MENRKLTQEDKARLAKIVVDAQKGNEGALSDLVQHTQDRLRRFLQLTGVDPTLAKDISQDTYLYVFEHLKELKKPEAVVAWLFRIAKHKFLDHRKSPRNSTHDDIDNREAHPSQIELLVGVRETLAHLDPDDQLLLLLVDMEGHTYQEVAEIMSISEAAATSRLRRARADFHSRYFDDRKRAAESPSIRERQWATKTTSR